MVFTDGLTLRDLAPFSLKSDLGPGPNNCRDGRPRSCDQRGELRVMRDAVRCEALLWSGMQVLSRNESNGRTLQDRNEEFCGFQSGTRPRMKEVVEGEKTNEGVENVFWESLWQRSAALT